MGKIASCVKVEADVIWISTIRTGENKENNYQSTQRHYIYLLRDFPKFPKTDPIQANLVTYNICQEHASKNHFKLYLQPAATLSQFREKLEIFLLSNHEARQGKVISLSILIKFLSSV